MSTDWRQQIVDIIDQVITENQQAGMPFYDTDRMADKIMPLITAARTEAAVAELENIQKVFTLPDMVERSYLDKRIERLKKGAARDE